MKSYDDFLTENPNAVLEQIKVLVYGKDVDSWKMWKTSSEGIELAEDLIENMGLKNVNGEEIDISFFNLPSDHASVGVNYENFWKTAYGKSWLKEHNITLKSKDKK